MFLVCGSWSRVRNSSTRQTEYLLSLGALDLHEHAVEPVNAFLDGTCVILDLARLGCNLSPWFALDHDVKVEQLVRQRGHVVFEAEGIFSDSVRRKDIVPGTLALSIEE